MRQLQSALYLRTFFRERPPRHAVMHINPILNRRNSGLEIQWSIYGVMGPKVMVPHTDLDYRYIDPKYVDLLAHEFRMGAMNHGRLHRIKTGKKIKPLERRYLGTWMYELEKYWLDKLGYEYAQVNNTHMFAVETTI